jgi:protein ImuB
MSEEAQCRRNEVEAATKQHRTLVVWCPDWPVLAAGVHLDTPAIVLHANRVVACSPAARAHGVAVGLRRREAQACCPAAEVHEHDLANEVRRFEPVLATVEAFTPRLEIAQPGACALSTRGPSRYFGGDEQLATRIASEVDQVLASIDATARCRIGVADGPFAAHVAARHRRARRRPFVVTAGETPAFLAPLSLRALEDEMGGPELVDVLWRLGLRTLGDFAVLPRGSVVGRFGIDGERAHCLASGLDERPPHLTDPPPELQVVRELDPPAERVEPAAFAARAMADELHQRLDHLGLACTRVLVCAETEHGERQERLWRHEGALSVAAIADRMRWQLDGWLSGPIRHRPTAGIIHLALVPDEVVPATGRQLGFWGGETEAAERASRALARVEGLLGPDAVHVPEWRGGRNPADQIDRVPVGVVDLTTRTDTPATVAARAGDPPWPGCVPVPSPAGVHDPALTIEVVDAKGTMVTVDGRGQVSAAPAQVVVAGARLGVAAWTGPWLVDERWWDDRRRRRRARFQVLTIEGTAHLVALEAGRWWCLATYD